MEFNFNCEHALNCDENGIAIIEGSFESNIRPSFKLHVKHILDILGEKSSQSQGLSITKTNSSNFFTSYDRIFILVNKNKALGYLRSGHRKMHIKDANNNYNQDNIISVIDFYVDKDNERKGYGKVF